MEEKNKELYNLDFPSDGVNFVTFDSVPEDRHVTKIKCKKCGDIIQTSHRHDMVWCKCGAVAIDGGNDYCKITGWSEDWEYVNDKAEGTDDETN